jgi:dienelactone hydrolase
MMRILGLSILILFVSLTAESDSKVVGETVEYKSDGTVLKGYIAYDDSIKGKRPGVLVVHEWWGLNDYVRKRADMLAGLGYTALAVDMYGEGKNSEHPEDAQKFVTEVMNNMGLGEKRFNAALELLRQQKTVNPEDIAAIGYCFGGAIVLHMARTGADLDGVTSFHGNLSPMDKAAPGKIQTKILVLAGGDDTFVPQEQVDAFRKEMDASGADYEIIIYPGAKHSFTSPDSDRLGKENNLPIAYNKEADEKSWTEMQEFLKEIFKPGND